MIIEEPQDQCTSCSSPTDQSEKDRLTQDLLTQVKQAFDAFSIKPHLSTCPEALFVLKTWKSTWTKAISETADLLLNKIFPNLETHLITTTLPTYIRMLLIYIGRQDTVKMFGSHLIPYLTDDIFFYELLNTLQHQDYQNTTKMTLDVPIADFVLRTTITASYTLTLPSPLTVHIYAYSQVLTDNPYIKRQLAKCTKQETLP